MSCTITPVSAFQSTNLNNRIDSFGKLGDRIVRALGAPIVTVEIHQDQLFDCIAQACEMFSKYAGFTKEYLIFNSALYETGRGIRLDHLYTLANSRLTLEDKVVHRTSSTDTAPYLEKPETVYVATTDIPSAFFGTSPTLSASFTQGIFANQILDTSTYNMLLTTFSYFPLSALFTESKRPEFTVRGEVVDTSPKYNNMFDYDVMDYRKVISVTDFEEGSSSGINTLFTIEQTLAQQTYFSYAMGNYGFDLISWYVMKDWLENREKLLCTKRSYVFDDRTQYMKLYPEPTKGIQFYGIVSCYVERPIRDLLKEAWVYQYALALTKTILGNTRGKFGNLTLFGGQVFSSDIMTQGMAEKEKLETQLFTNAAAFGDGEPVSMMIG